MNETNHCYHVCVRPSLCVPVCKVTHEHGGKCRPNVVGMGSGWCSRSRVVNKEAHLKPKTKDSRYQGQGK